MNSFFPILNWAGLLLPKEKLSHCTPYQEAEWDSRAQWAAFKASHSEALYKEVREFRYPSNQAAAREPHAAIWSGHQLGLELGGLGRFWDTEPQGTTL